jgi:hypothetical protein
MSVLPAMVRKRSDMFATAIPAIPATDGKEGRCRSSKNSNCSSSKFRESESPSGAVVGLKCSTDDWWRRLSARRRAGAAGGEQ